jgi:excisionase family DNA binding protein
MIDTEPQRMPKGNPSLATPFGVTPANTFEPLLTADTAADLLGIHTVTLRRWAREGRVPRHRLGSKVKFRASELNTWLQSGYTDRAVHAASPERKAA